MRNLSDLTVSQLTKTVTLWGEPTFRAGQIQRWAYKRLASDYSEMTDLPKPLRDKLAEEVALSSVTAAQEATSADGLTRRVLFRLADSKTIESVLMDYQDEATSQSRRTVCVSTQVGCALGCAFCATGRQGFERNLTAAEIADQVLYFARKLRQAGSTQAITNVVVMGMGEPLANYDATMQAIKLLHSPDAFGLGARHFTISTAGLLAGIKRLAHEDLQVGLAISLHAAVDSLRDRLMPINKTFPLPALMGAVRDYLKDTGRRPTFEYVMLNGTNDSPTQAAHLARLLSGLNCHVNLIPANPTGLGGFQPSTSAHVRDFQQVLSRSGIAFTLRQRRGQDIDAGCGQLRSRYLQLAR